MALDTILTTATRIKQMASGMLLRHQRGKQVMHALNYSCVSKLLGEKYCTIVGRGCHGIDDRDSTRRNPHRCRWSTAEWGVGLP